MSARIYDAAVPYDGPRDYDGQDAAPGVLPPALWHSVATPWQTGTVAQQLQRLAWRASAAHQQAAATPWQPAQAWQRVAALRLHQSAVHDGVAALAWGQFRAHGRMSVARWSHAAASATGYAAVWADYLGHHAAGTDARWRQITPHAVTRAVPWGALAAHALQRSAVWRAIAARGGFVAVPWGRGRARDRGVGVPWPVQPDPPPGTIVIPSLPVYIMIPTLSAVLLPDRTPLHMLSASLALDADTWAWTFSAPIPHVELAKIDLADAENPPEIELSINGYVWTFLVDGFDDNRRFGSRTATLRGRSRSAVLAQPYAPARAYLEPEARTAAQLAEQELDGTGWTLAWDAVDWLVPGGTWSYQDLAPVEAIARLAESIGAVVESHPADRALTVKPAYATSPWEWGAASPYAILPAAVLTQGSGAWEGGTNADGVYVYAETAAVGALVKITGTAGDAQLPMIVEQLAVHADAQRERGRQALSRAGRVRSVTRTMPLFPPPADPGVVPRGALVEVEDATTAGGPPEVWRGMVTGVRIEASRNGSALSVRQHLSIERQYRDA